MLQENAAIRASVEVVTVTVKRVGMHGYHEDLNEGFRQLVGELPRLRDVRSVTQITRDDRDGGERD